MLFTHWFTASLLLQTGVRRQKDWAIFTFIDVRAAITIKPFKPFLWMGLIFLTLSLLNDLSARPDHLGYRFLNHVWKLSYVTVLHYLFFAYVIAGVRKRPFLLSALFLLAQILFYSWGLYLWRLLGIALRVYTVLVTFNTTGHAVADQMTYSITSLAFFTLANHIYHYFRLRNTAQQLRIEKQQAELNYLKSQTNPHFLFNTLNNIYSLARIKSDLAPESILRLSKILRFMLYESSGTYISVERELKIINDYIELEKLRYDPSLLINFSCDVEDMRQSLPPLLLMPLVENAFKHGASEARGHSFVDIHLSIKNRRLAFAVKNSCEEADGTGKENIGLSNLRRQLELLYTDYVLLIQPEESVFTATLKINLASHV